MLRVELIYDTDCPNVADARKTLLAGFSAAGVQPSWTEWDRASPESPPHARRYGSPSILVDGKDVAGAQAAGAACCRVYDHGGGAFRGVPPVEQVATRIARAAGAASATKRPRRSLWSLLAALPGIGAALLPAGLCPACWPLYGGVLSALGLGFLLESSVALPLVAAFLGLALWALAFRARTRRGYGPFALGVASAAVIVAAKSIWGLEPLAYAGAAGLAAASIWNVWPRRRNSTGSCPRCARGEPAVQGESA